MSIFFLYFSNSRLNLMDTIYSSNKMKYCKLAIWVWILTYQLCESRLPFCSSSVMVTLKFVSSFEIYRVISSHETRYSHELIYRSSDRRRKVLQLKHVRKIIHDSTLTTYRYNSIQWIRQRGIVLLICRMYVPGVESIHQDNLCYTHIHKNANRHWSVAGCIS